MSNTDQIQRLLFDDADVRGVITSLDQSFKDALAKHRYPVVVENILGQMLAAVTILSTNLKFEAKLSLQAKGDGDISLLMAECNQDNECRAVAQHADSVNPQQNFLELLGSGHLVITIDPASGQRYQGFVPLERETLAQCLEDYFERSEQLKSKFMLAADEGRAAGFMLQALPSSTKTPQQWEHLSLLAQTLSEQELLSVEAELLLYRLFHEDKCRLFEPQAISFRCDCSRERSARALKLMGRDELDDIIHTQSVIEMGCQFCNTNYQFYAEDIDAIFSAENTGQDSKKVH
ncbi:MAG: Hsp33 family molecular chaperone HslO [Pseudomonadales bacterium]